MSLIHKFTRGLHSYIQKQTREIRREFISGLKKYKYIMIYPFHNDDGREDSCINTCVMVGFSNTNHHMQMNDEREAYGWLETDNSDTNVFYLHSAYVDLCDKIYYISTEEFPDIIVSKAPIEIALNAPSLGEAEPDSIAYHVYDYIGDVHTKDFDDILKETIKGIPDIEHYTIFEDIHLNDRSIKLGRATEIVKYKSEVIAFITKSGYDMCRNECYPMNSTKWRDFVEMIIAESNIREMLCPRYTVIDPTKDCDIYFAVPGVSGYYYDSKQDGVDLI